MIFLYYLGMSDVGAKFSIIGDFFHVKLLTAVWVLHNFLLNEPFLTEEELNALIKRSLVDEDDPEITGSVQLNNISDSRRRQIFEFVLEHNHRF